MTEAVIENHERPDPHVLFSALADPVRWRIFTRICDSDHTVNELAQSLAALDGPVAVLSFTDPKKPAIIAPANEDGESTSGYWYLIMPVRIGG